MSAKTNSKQIKALISLLLSAMISPAALALSSGITPIDSKDSAFIQQAIQNPDIAQFLSPSDYKYTIKNGDNLSRIFKKFGFKYADLMKVMEVDLNYLSLDTIQPGAVIKLWKAQNSNRLIRLELQLNPADSVSYTLNGDSYEYNTYTDPGVWKEKAISGEITISLASAAKKAGLTNAEIAEISSIFQSQIDFSSDLRKGDRFEVVRKTQYIKGEKTKNSELELVKIYNDKNIHTAVIHSDGQFYNGNGQSLQQAFDRRPVSSKYRISSSYNPTRKHPVTGRIAPHNGTDFATPTGTPIHSIGDGVVVMIRNHPYAGKYVVIKHNNTYKTRYLHMSKILVKKGQKIARGQKIGLSGSTGRVTGAHLHYELLIHDRAVNAMTAKIPLGNSVPDSEMSGFIDNRFRLEGLF